MTSGRRAILRIAIPILEGIGAELREMDDNEEGGDDLAGAAIEYGAQVTDAVLKKQPIPYPPDILLRGGRPKEEAPVEEVVEEDTAPLELPSRS